LIFLNQRPLLSGCFRPGNSGYYCSNRRTTDAELIQRLAENYTDGQYRR
jgi:hypothetical protein